MFQSTRPARGATCAVPKTNSESPVSIHAPRAGRDNGPSAESAPPASFNPRAPRGARHSISHAAPPNAWFQSTRPARGATISILFNRTHKPVSIHAPRAGRDIGSLSQRYSVNVSIHAPRAGRDCRRSIRAWCMGGFNPRAPRGARRSFALPHRTGTCFNPRAPRGARRERILHGRHYSWFQSTRPARGATTDRQVS